MRICIDVDGTICHLRENTQNYQDVAPIKGAVQALKQLNKQGHYIILCTARHMKTCEANLGKVIAKEGLNLMQWLQIHDFVFDELWFGKPYADIYIDDKALTFSGCWDSIHNKITNDL